MGSRPGFNCPIHKKMSITVSNYSFTVNNLYDASISEIFVKNMIATVYVHTHMNSNADDYVTIDGSEHFLNGVHRIKSLCTDNCKVSINNIEIKLGQIIVTLQKGFGIDQGVVAFKASSSVSQGC